MEKENRVNELEKEAKKHENDTNIQNSAMDSNSPIDFELDLIAPIKFNNFLLVFAENWTERETCKIDLNS